MNVVWSLNSRTTRVMPVVQINFHCAALLFDLAFLKFKPGARFVMFGHLPAGKQAYNRQQLQARFLSEALS
ncbi:MAG: hypothetical protein WCS42_16140 [Verrucomicrobiota bacterium]